MGFWVTEIAVSEGNRNQMGKLIHGLLSIKGFCNIGAGEAEQDSTCSISAHKYAAQTHTHAHYYCY